MRRKYEGRCAPKMTNEIFLTHWQNVRIEAQLRIQRHRRGVSFGLFSFLSAPHSTHPYGPLGRLWLAQIMPFNVDDGQAMPLSISPNFAHS